MYLIDIDEYAADQLSEISLGNETLNKKIEKTIGQLKNDPKIPSLRSEKKFIKHPRIKGKVWVSRIDRNWRVAWDFHPRIRGLIVIVAFGEHSGSNSIYR